MCPVPIYDDNMERVRAHVVAQTTKSVDFLAITIMHSYFDGLATEDNEALCFRLCRTFADFAASMSPGSLDPAVCALLSYVFAKVKDGEKNEAVVLKVLGRNGFPCFHHLQLLKALETLLLDTDVDQRANTLSRPVFEALLAHLVDVVISQRDGMDLLGTSAVEHAHLSEEAARIIGILATFSCGAETKGPAFADLVVMALSDQVRASSVPDRFVLRALIEAADNAPRVFAKHAKQMLLKLIPSLGAISSNLIACCYCDLLVSKCNAINLADAAQGEKRRRSGDIASAFPSVVGSEGAREDVKNEHTHASSCGDALATAMGAIESSWLISPVAILQAKATEATGSMTLAMSGKRLRETLPNILRKVLSALRGGTPTKHSPAKFRGLHALLKTITRSGCAGLAEHCIDKELGTIIDTLREYLSLVFKEAEDVDPTTLAYAMRTQGEILRCFQTICTSPRFFHKVLDRLSQARESTDRCVSCLVLRHLINFEPDRFTQDKDGALSKATALPVRIMEEAIDQPSSRAELCRLVVAMGESEILAHSNDCSRLVAFVVEHATLSNREVSRLEEDRKL